MTTADPRAGDSLYGRPAYYGLLFDERAADLPFYLELAAEGPGPVLEVGVGTGRVAIPLARAGHRVTGVDLSSSMLHELRRRLAGEPEAVRALLDAVQADARTMDLGRAFPLITCPFNGMAHLHTDSDVGAFLGRVQAHLAPGGRFALDTVIPDPGLLRGSSWEIPWFRDPETGEVARCTESACHDPATGVLTITSQIRFMESDRATEELTLRLAQRPPDRYRGLLTEHGFQVERETDHLGDSVAYVCRRASG